MGNAVAVGTAGHPGLSGHALRVLTDEKLAALAASGNDDAFAVLYGRHHQSVYRYCRSLLRQEADARDALQSSMLAALAALRARPIEGAFKPWLFRIAHNESISIIRRSARDAPTEAPPEAVSTADDPQARDDLRTLVSDLAALPERQRGAIVMRELNGLSYAEIAAVLATSEAGGKQLVYEARTALHDLRAGHEMGCELVRERISARDMRLLRGRKVRAHLRGCQPCQDFEEAIRRRRTAFAALAPPLAPLAAAAVLQDVLGGGAGGGAGGAGAAVAGTSGASSVGAPLTAFKVVAAALMAGAAGVGAYGAATGIFADPAISTSAAASHESAHSGAHSGAASHQAAQRGNPAGRPRSAHDGSGGAGPDGNAKAQPAAHGFKPPGESGPQQTTNAPPSTTAGAGGSGDPSGSGTGSGSGDPGGGSGGGTVDPPPPPPPPGGDGDAPAGTPPGHGGTPPGHAGTPPGQAGGDVPPGQIDNPGHGGGP